MLSAELTAGGSNLRAHTGSICALYCCAQAGCGAGSCAGRWKSAHLLRRRQVALLLGKLMRTEQQARRLQRVPSFNV